MRRPAAILIAMALPVAMAAPAFAAANPNPDTPRVAVAGPVSSAVKRLPKAPTNASVTVDIQLPLRHLKDAETIANAVATPGNRNYHKYLTPAQFNNRYAPTTKQVRQVRDFATKAGLKVVSVPANHRYVEVRGTTAQVGKLFHVGIRTEAVAGRTALVADRTPTVPKSMQPNILSVTGLSDVHAEPSPSATAPVQATTSHHVQRSDLTRTAPRKRLDTAPVRHKIDAPCSSFWGQHYSTMPTAYNRTGFPTVVCGYTPQQLQSAYGVQGMIANGRTGKGVTVAIVDAYNLKTMRADADHYSRDMGLPVFKPGQYHTIEPKSYDMQQACGADSWAGEQALDVEAVHGLAPDAKITYVAGKNCDYNGLLDPLNTIVSKRLASIVSNSWGFAGEFTSPTAELRATHAILVQAAAEGIGMYFCTLDDGDGALSTGSAQADFPASDPFATGVGGTTLGISADGTRDFEVGWGETWAPVKWDATGKAVGYTVKLPGNFSSGGGGGISEIYRQPAYQRGVVPKSLASFYGGPAMRVEPDIAADASGSTPLVTGYTYGGKYSTTPGSGTSLATPIIASLVALAQQDRKTPIGFANPALYSTQGRRTLLDIRPTRSPIAVSWVYDDPANGCYQTCLLTTDRDTSLHTAPGFDDVTGLGVPKNSSFVTFLHRR